MVYVYSRYDCRDCVKLVSLLNLLDIEYKEYMLNVDYTESGLKRIVPEIKGYPQIFNNLTYIGGAVESFKYFSELCS